VALENNISVIIPVYNAAAFVGKAVESVLMQPEVGEIILVEDGSTDNSLEICESLAVQFELVKLFTHPNNANRGAGMSRNLGINKAACKYIAFLDADDFYLPDRFRAEREIFLHKLETDGVYGALGFHYYSTEGEKSYNEKGFTGALTTISGKVSANELFRVLVGFHEKYHGHFSIDTLTIKRDVFFGKTEMFNLLPMHEDTVFFIQLSLNCKLEAGIIEEPIGYRGVHDNNRIVNNNKKSGSLVIMWRYLYEWSLDAANGKQYSQLFRAFLMREKVLLSNRFSGFFNMILFGILNKVFLAKGVFFNPSSTHVFGNFIGRKLIFFKGKIQCKFFKSDPNENYVGFKLKEKR
jgi:glycosyltransferase involved in cell wall biosynthesis